MYKYNEYTEEEFNAYNQQLGGTFTYLVELPHGTKFHCHNGNWEGKVIHKEDGVYLQTTLDDSLCINGENQRKISNKVSLWITILKD